MSFEDELSKRLRHSVDGVTADGDLADVEARSSRVHRRHQIVLTAGVAALVVVAIGAVAVVGTRDGGTSGPTVAPVDTPELGTTPEDSPATTAPDGSVGEPSVPTTIDPAVPTSAVETDLSAPPTSALPGVDRAEQYLVGSHEIYRRTLPDGQVFVARLSDGTYADVFDEEWRAPTGSADECLGDHAVFIGVPDTMGYWGSAWIATRWNDDVDLAQPVVAASMATGSDPMFDPMADDAGHFLVRTGPDALQVVVVAPDGSEIDRADVVDGLAMVQAPLAWTAEVPPRLSAVTADGQQSAPTSFNYTGSGVVPADCGPGDPPVRPLPPAGAQPSNAASAIAQIRERHAILVDRSIPKADKPPDLLDDRTGIDDAVEQATSGQYGSAVATASYNIDEIVFTDPTTAWFRYTITAPTGTFADRFGMATFNGRVWQITRATLCGDLALAGATCQPPTAPVQPPEDPDWLASYQEWVARANLYTGNDGCSPLSQC